ncbi:hypothetical protein OH77DRAFT_1520403 [Trametes cingulata]|nr:hypothetical protein OH77DRAFT_1520403 [Trametes cingulata]
MPANRKASGSHAARYDLAPTPDAPLPRPRNPWILFRKEQLDNEKAAGIEDKDETVGQKSQRLAALWNNAPKEFREKYEEMARQPAAAHAAKYPNYKYQPRTKAEKLKLSGRRRRPWNTTLRLCGPRRRAPQVGRARAAGAMVARQREKEKVAAGDQRRKEQVAAPRMVANYLR